MMCRTRGRRYRSWSEEVQDKLIHSGAPAEEYVTKMYLSLPKIGQLQRKFVIKQDVARRNVPVYDVGTDS